MTPCAVQATVKPRALWDCGNAPGGGGGDLLVVVFGEDLKELVEKNWQEADNDVDPLHAEETLHIQAYGQNKPKPTTLVNNKTPNQHHYKTIKPKSTPLVSNKTQINIVRIHQNTPKSTPLENNKTKINIINTEGTQISIIDLMPQKVKMLQCIPFAFMNTGQRTYQVSCANSLTY